MILKVENLTKNFGGLRAVNNVSLEIKKGEIVGLIGPNGAGKTTVFNLISGFHLPSSGKIFFNNEDISKLRPPHKIAKKGLARTFQLPKPFGANSVLENVMIAAFSHTGDKKKAKYEATKILDFLKLSDIKNLLTENLTGPYLKRLEVAKSLATKPVLLMLDEVMAGLNATEIQEMVNIIKEIRKSGITIFVVEHIMAAIMNLSDRVIVLHFGEKIAEGSPDDIIRNEKVIESYLGEDFLIA